MGLDRFQKIARAARLKTASRVRAEENRQHRRNQHLIAAYQKADKENHGWEINTAPRVARFRHSWRNSSNAAFAARWRATITIQHP